jgi:small-conductance mechanosensitive channel
MNDIWNFTILNNTVKNWLIALGIIAVTMMALRLIRSLVIKKLRAFTTKTQTTIDDLLIGVIQSSVMPVLYVLAFYAGLRYLALPEKAETVLHIAMMAVVTFFVLRTIITFIKYGFNRALSSHELNQQREKQSKGILLIVQIIVWLAGILFLIDNLGYDITAIVAGLGIGGIAIALAAQTILGDLFSYLVIFFDKPFEIGDFIIMDDKMGTVEYIGIKTTRIRTLGGEQLVCSNTDLTNSRVHNYKRMQDRRIVFSFGVTYSTSAAVMKEIPLMVKKIVESASGTRFDRAHFKSFGDFSLGFEVVYYVLSPDYNIYMDTQQNINIQILELFEERKIEFAFPTQTLFLNRVQNSNK